MRSRPYEPHRRNSVVLAGNEAGGDGGLEFSESMQISSSSSPQSRPNRSDLWQATEVMQASPPLLEEDPRPRQEREASRRILSSTRRNQLMVMELERRNARRLESRRRERLRNSYLEVEGMGQHDTESRRHGDSESYLGTTGCLMSNDGRRL